MSAKEYLAGMKAGVPVCIGHLLVSFGFGAVAGCVCVYIAEQLLQML